MPVKGIEVEGYREFQRHVSKAADRDLSKQIGQVHKEIGQHVISKLRPRPVPEAVGAGAGASVRASATRREVLLRVGGTHRDHPSSQITRMRPWGRRRVGGIGPKPSRPHIIGTARDEEDAILRMLRDGVLDAMKPAFWDVDRR